MEGGSRDRSISAGPEPQSATSEKHPAPPGSTGPSDAAVNKRKRGLGVVTPNACTECRKKRAKVRLAPVTLPMFLSAKVLQSLTTVFEQSSATETNHAEGVNPRESNVFTKSQFDSPRRTSGARLSSFGSSRNRTIPS